MKSTSVRDLDMDDVPTAKTCPECRGGGTITIELGTRYTVATCKWCKGSGRIPVSGEIPAVLDPKHTK